MSERAWAVLTIKSVSQREDSRLIEGIASTPAVDRANDVVEPLGARFTLPLPLLWHHRADEPVGEVEFAQPTKDGIPFRARIFKETEAGEFKNMVDKAWHMVKAGAVRGVSIGFKTRERDTLKNGGWRIKAWDWFELSLVTLPANAEATITSIKSFDRQTPAAPGQSRAASSTPGAAGPHQEGTKMQSLNEQITAQEDKRADAAERLKALMAKEDDGQLDEAEANEIETLQGEITNANKKLKNLRLLESSSTTARPVDQTPAPRPRLSVPAQPKPPKDGGLGFARKIQCMGQAYLDNGSSDPRSCAQIAKQRYPGDDWLQAEFKAAVAGAITIDATWAGNLVTPINYTADFIDYLRETTIIGKFGTGGVPALRRIPFNVLIK